ncbi:MAG: NDP-hexose 2,3-dehydratase family protein [Clostridia bacterium]|nr:NDP-hexose 2,3-dehydratase family protein [Clostridia bacterium]
MATVLDFFRSWRKTEGCLHSKEELLSWIDELNTNTEVKVEPKSLDGAFWYYDEQTSSIQNRKNAFFSIRGIRLFKHEKAIKEQPILLQSEIGFLGILCKKIDGVLYFLMQGKIEPGNINEVQISPTIQATKSNFTRVHGGKTPPFLSYFEHPERYRVISDILQSEQGSRFFRKRNRNMILEVEEDIPESAVFRWMTLGQIKEFTKYDNLINMNSRTVLSSIPLDFSACSKDDLAEIKRLMRNDALFASFTSPSRKDELCRSFGYLNEQRMFTPYRTEFLPLSEVRDWNVTDQGIFKKDKKADFSIGYYKICIEGREVREWDQPLVNAEGRAVFALLTAVIDGERKFLIHGQHEVGSFDVLEFGPSVQWEPTHAHEADDEVECLFSDRLKTGKGILHAVKLSEEGGRFYHEENENYIVEIDQKELTTLPGDYFWVSLATMQSLVAIPSCFNIQLRSLLSLISL